MVEDLEEKLLASSHKVDLEEKQLASSQKVPAPPMTIKTKCRRLLLLMLIIIFGLCPFHPLIITITDEFKPPKVPEFNVNSLSLSLINEEANWNATFSIKNLSENTTIRYEAGQVWMFYGKEYPSKDLITPFYLGSEEEILVHGNFESNSIDRESAKNMVVDFSVFMQVSFILNPNQCGSSPEFDALLAVNCKAVKVKFCANSMVGTMLGGKKRCEVDTID